MGQLSKDKFTASFIGLCLGDALGFPVEGYPPAICERYVSQFLMTGLAGQWNHYPYPFGQYSDDGQMTRTLIESLTASKTFDPADIASRLAQLFESKKVIGQGRSTQEAVQRLIHGVSWKNAGTLPPTAGNSSTVRAVAIGLYYCHQPEKMIQAASDQSWITHQDPRCLAGSITIAGATAMALQTDKIEAQTFINQLIKWTQDTSSEFSDHLGHLSTWLALTPEEAAVKIARVGIDDTYQDNWHGISPFVVSSVLWSLYAFLKHADDYWDTICTAIAAGGDTDTTAAMAGGISGAYLGEDHLPGHLVTKLDDQGRWSYDQLVVLIEELYELVHN